MKRWMLTVLSVPLTLFAVCVPAFAHHGAAAYDRTVTLTLKATITEFVFRNPHIILSFDAPDDADTIERIIDQLRSDELLLYASDFPHWQFDGESAMPPGLPESLQRKILIENPLATYPRLKEAVT